MDAKPHPQVRLTLWSLACLALGALLGCAALLADEAPVARAEPSREGAGGAEGKSRALPVSGRARTTIRDFVLRDPEGYEVLKVGYLSAKVDMDPLQEARIAMPAGKARDLSVVLRKGESGRVSLSEAFHRGDPPSPAEARRQSRTGMLVDIGPLAVEQIDLRVQVSELPVVVHMQRAKVRVHRDEVGDAPRIHFHDIRGKLVSPDPLPGGIDIRGGTGVVDLEAEPLADFRVRVCLANSELRLRIRVPHRDPGTTHLVADGERLLGVTSEGVLNLVAAFKETLSVEDGEVDVPGKPCGG